VTFEFEYINLLVNKSSVQRPTSADNVTLLAFAAERRAALRLAAAAIDRYLLPAEPTAANPPQRHAAVDRWDVRSNTVPLHRPRRILCNGVNHFSRVASQKRY